MRYIVTFILFFATAFHGAAAQTEPSVPGPLPVGFQVVQQYDYARVFLGEVDPVTGKANTGERARPVQTLI
jgi:hypothetical protein